MAAISASAAMLANTAITLAFLLATGRRCFPPYPRCLVGRNAHLKLGASGLAAVAWFSALKYLKARRVGGRLAIFPP